MNNNKIIAAVVGLVVVAGIAYVFYVQPQPTQAPSTDVSENTSNQSTTDSDGGNVGIDVNVTTGASMSAAVTYNGSSFSPSVVTVKKGGTVTFTNQSSGSMWVGSDEHPTHTDYDGTNRSQHCAAGYTGAKAFDQCAVGSSYSFTFNKTGTFGYHNHLNASAVGTVKVVD